MRNNNSSEDYLKCILVLKEKNGHVRSVDVAGEMGVTKPSVSNAMKKLRKEGLISFDEEGYISFSDAGREIAEKVHDKHLLITKVLMRIGVSEQTASKEACMIEHAISDETYRCLQNFHSDYKPEAG
ncbi:MAG: metal-dependent transcriptional regulator [Lachnospiraceae bacterium]|nr:metal-dependent transcriptional regulator [Lachnospiraceae bacterium]